jgi:selenocysteine-specific translation elongation factor
MLQGKLLGIFPKKREKRNLGVCIPEHRKKKTQRYAEQIMKQQLSASKNAQFLVDGLYQVEGTLMLSGVVLSGTIKQGMKLALGEHELEITEIRCLNKSVEKLSAGERGAVFLNESRSLFKTGEVLIFK